MAEELVDARRVVELLLQRHRERLASGTVTTSEVAMILGMSEATVKRWADSGRIPSDRSPGGHRRFSAAGVASLLNREPSLRERVLPGEEVVVELSAQGVSSPA